MRVLNRVLMMVALVAAAPMLVAGCDREKEATIEIKTDEGKVERGLEKAGEKTDEALDTAGKNTDKALDRAGDAVDDADKKVDVEVKD